MLLSASPLAETLGRQDEIQGHNDNQTAILASRLSGCDADAQATSTKGQDDVTPLTNSGANSSSAKPEIPYLSVADKLVWNTDIPVTISVSDPDGDLAGWRVKLYNQDGVTEHILASGESAADFLNVGTLKLADYANGSYRIVVEAWDKAGNRSERSFSFTIDSSAPVSRPPEFPYLSVADKSVWNTDIPVTISVSDPDGDLAGWRVKLYNQAGTTEHILASGESAADFLNVGTLKLADYANGSYRIIVEAWDKAGNRSERSFSFTIDSSAPTSRPPEFPYLSVAEKAVWNTDIPVTISVSDPDGDLAGWRVKLYKQPGTTEHILASGESAADFLNVGTLKLADYANGFYCIVVEAWDKAGNRSERNFSFTIDSSAPISRPPEFPYLSVADKEVWNTDIPVIISVSDPDGDLACWRVKLYNQSGTTEHIFASGESAADFLNVGTLKLADYANGSYRIVVEAWDKAGNRNERSFSFTIDSFAPDSRPPEIPYLSVADKMVWDTDIPVTISVSDPDGDLAGWQVKLYNQAWGMVNTFAFGEAAVDFMNVGTLKLADYANGFYRIVVEAWDADGNRSRRHFDFQIKAANPEPTPSVITLKHDWPNDPQFLAKSPRTTITFTVTADGIESIVSRTLTVNGLAVALDADGKGTFVVEIPGPYVVVATVIDAAGVVTTETIALEAKRGPGPDWDQYQGAGGPPLFSDASYFISPGQRVTFNASNASSFYDNRLTINGQEISFDQTGPLADTNYGSYIFNTLGAHTITLTSINEYGVLSVTSMVLMVVEDVNTAGAPMELEVREAWKEYGDHVPGINSPYSCIVAPKIDENATITSISATINGAPAKVIDISDRTDNGLTYGVGGKFLEPGTYVFIFTVEDSNGNRAVYSESLVVGNWEWDAPIEP